MLIGRKKFNRVRSAFVISVAIAVAGTFTVPLAVADEKLDDKIINALVSVPTERGVLQDIDMNSDQSARLPTDPGSGIPLTSSNGSTLEVMLPFAEQAADGIAVTEGVLAYDNANGSVTVPVAKSDGSVQITTIINGTSAPTVYKYDIIESALKIFDDGSVIIQNKEGDYLGGVLPPWAFDAVGTPVNTWYEVQGSSLVQHVAHGEGSYTYPIVADPWLGFKLFSWITVDSYNGQPRVNLQPSPWGYAQWPSVGGQVIMNTAGWDEAWNWNYTVRSGLNKNSQRQQFECHALGSPFAGTWNLEKFRPNRTSHWSYGVAIHRCNWVTSHQY